IVERAGLQTVRNRRRQSHRDRVVRLERQSREVLRTDVGVVDAARRRIQVNLRLPVPTAILELRQKDVEREPAADRDLSARDGRALECGVADAGNLKGRRALRDRTGYAGKRAGGGAPVARAFETQDGIRAHDGAGLERHVERVRAEARMAAPELEVVV